MKDPTLDPDPGNEPSFDRFKFILENSIHQDPNQSLVALPSAPPHASNNTSNLQNIYTNLASPQYPSQTNLKIARSLQNWRSNSKDPSEPQSNDNSGNSENLRFKALFGREILKLKREELGLLLGCLSELTPDCSSKKADLLSQSDNSTSNASGNTVGNNMQKFFKIPNGHLFSFQKEFGAQLQKFNGQNRKMGVGPADDLQSNSLCNSSFKRIDSSILLYIHQNISFDVIIQ